MRRGLIALIGASLAVTFLSPGPAVGSEAQLAPHSRAATSLAGAIQAPYRAAQLPATKRAKVASTRLRANLVVNTTTIRAGKKVVVRTKGSRAAKGVKRITVRFGDGTKQVLRKKGLKQALKKRVNKPAIRLKFPHRYTKRGVYTIRLVVKDRANKTARTKRQILVTPKKSQHRLGAQWPDAENAVRVPTASAPTQVGAGAPNKVNLRKWAMPVGNQGDLSSCVAWTTGYAMMGWYHNKAVGKQTTFAPMYVYSQINGGVDNGSYAADALQVLSSQGIDTAAHYGAGWATDWRTRPNAAQRANAARYRAQVSQQPTVFSLSNKNMDAAKVGPNAAEIEAMKQHLAAQRPVAVAFRVRANIDRYTGGWYRGAGIVTGLHEVLAVGYTKKGLILQNSWGRQSGAKGYIKMRWDTVKKDLYEAMVIDGAVFTSAAVTDTIKPTITSFTRNYAPGWQVSHDQVPMTFSWAGTDNKGITQYVLYYRIAGGEWMQLGINALQTEVTYYLATGYQYQFALAAYDAAGNLSDWSYTEPFTPAQYTEAQYMSYSSGWERLNNGNYLGGWANATQQAGAWMLVDVQTGSFGLIGTMGPLGGKADLYVNDGFQFTFDTYHPSASYRTIVAWLRLNRNQVNRISIVAHGTAGRPWVEVDGFLLD